MLTLAGCAAQPSLDATTSSEMFASNPPAGKARVFIFVGRTYWKDGSEPIKIGTKEISFDGKVIGKVGVGEVLMADLSAGRHTLTRFNSSIFGPVAPISVELNLTAGEKRYFAANHYQNLSPSAAVMGGVLGGAVGGLIVGAMNNADNGGKAPGDYLEESHTGTDDIRSMRLIAASSQP